MDLSEIYLEYARLSRAQLTNADLDCSLLPNVDLSGARLSGTVRDVVFLGANLTGADLRGADLSRSLFVGTESNPSSLRQADFRNATLSGALFRNVSLDGADFSNATFDRTWFVRLDLSKVRGLEPERLQQACLQEVTPERLSNQAQDCQNFQPPIWFDPLCDLPTRRANRRKPFSESMLEPEPLPVIDVPDSDPLAPSDFPELLNQTLEPPQLLQRWTPIVGQVGS